MLIESETAAISRTDTTSLVPRSIALSELVSFVAQGGSIPMTMDDHTVWVEPLLDSPRIVRFRQLLSWEEVVYLKRNLPRGADNVEKSEGLPLETRGRSETLWFWKRADPIVSRIEKRLEVLSGTLPTRLEPLQITMHYPGSFMPLHLDAYNSLISADQTHLSKAGQRTKTWLIYLSDSSDGMMGGTTVFPRLNLEITPFTGMGILWENIGMDGEVDARLLHCGLPAEGALRLVVTTWCRGTDIPGLRLLD